MKRLGEALTEHPAPGTLVAALRGEVDVTNAEELVGQVAAEATNEVERLVLDLSELSFLDSSGIRALIGLVRRVQARGALARGLPLTLLVVSGAHGSAAGTIAQHRSVVGLVGLVLADVAQGAGA